MNASEGRRPPEQIEEHWGVKRELTPAEAVWHERLGRRLHPENFDARHRLLVHELLAIHSGRPDRLEAIVDGICRWQPMPPERGTPEFIERETRRVWDELGTLLGIGPKP